MRNTWNKVKHADYKRVPLFTNGGDLYKLLIISRYAKSFLCPCCVFFTNKARVPGIYKGPAGRATLPVEFPIGPVRYCLNHTSVEWP